MKLRFATPFILTLTLLFPPGVSSQPEQQGTKLRLAQSYEQAGDFEQAVNLYTELQRIDPQNFLYFDGLRRTYLQLKRYDDAVQLIRQRLVIAPDMNLRAMLGGVFYKAGREKEANSEWEAVIASDPSNQNVYRIVANTLLENRLLEKTAEMYRRGRTACNDPNLFTVDLAHLLAVSMDYEGSAVEYVRWLQTNPTQLGFVQGRMASFTGKDDGRNAAIAAVSRAMKEKEDVRLHQLLGWLYLEGKRFEEAFSIYQKLDRLNNAQGAELYNFADRVFKEGSFEIAARAYLQAIKVPVSPARMPFARYGYASSLKEMSALSDTMAGWLPSSGGPVAETHTRYSGAVGYFREIIAEYPRTEFSAKSYYQIGTIQLERFRDLDAALASFEAVGRELPGPTPIHHAVALKIAEVHLMRGDTARASAGLRSIASLPTATPDQQDEATYRLAEIDYFGGAFQRAIEQLSGITMDLGASYTNDALGLLAFLQENVTTGEDALKEFARADFLARQNKNTEAIALFRSVIARFPEALLVDDGLLRIAALQTRAGLFADAIKSYERLLTEFREKSISADRALFNIGEIYQFGLQDRPRAITSYESLLADFPSSLMVTTARKRIRALRGDTL